MTSDLRQIYWPVGCNAVCAPGFLEGWSRPEKSEYSDLFLKKKFEYSDM